DNCATSCNSPRSSSAVRSFAHHSQTFWAIWGRTSTTRSPANPPPQAFRAALATTLSKASEADIVVPRWGRWTHPRGGAKQPVLAVAFQDPHYRPLESPGPALAGCLAGRWGSGRQRGFPRGSVIPPTATNHPATRRGIVAAFPTTRAGIPLTAAPGAGQTRRRGGSCPSAG